MNTDFFKPRETPEGEPDLICRHPDGRPINAEGEVCPVIPHYMKYVLHGDLVKGGRNVEKEDDASSAVTDDEEETEDTGNGQQEAADDQASEEPTKTRRKRS